MILSEDIHLSYKPKHYTLFSYDQLVDFEVLEDGTSVASGGLGRAVVGGVLFGGVGAVVGGVTGRKKSKEICKQLKIKLTVKDYFEPAFYINVISTETKKKGLIWQKTMKEVENTLAQLQLITNSLEQPDTPAEVEIPTQANDPVEEIRKYKALLDEGIISEDEFEAKKKELLGL